MSEDIANPPENATTLAASERLCRVGGSRIPHAAQIYFGAVGRYHMGRGEQV